MPHKAIAFIATSQPARALPLYRDVLGLRLLEDTPFALVFDAFGTMYPPFEQDARGIWTAPDGARVFWFHDPDRNLLSLSQFDA